MNEDEGDKHHKFTLAVWDQPELGEHEITVYGANWDSAFGKAAKRLEEELGLGYGSGVKNIKEWPVQHLPNPDEAMIRRFESLDDNIEEERDEKLFLLECGVLAKYILECKKTEEYADLRALGHWALANQIEAEQSE